MKPHCSVGPLSFAIPSIYGRKRIYGTAVPLKYVKLAHKMSVGIGLRIFLARDVIYKSHAYATMSVSVCLSICPSVCDGSALAHYS